MTQKEFTFVQSHINFTERSGFPAVQMCML